LEQNTKCEGVFGKKLKEKFSKVQWNVGTSENGPECVKSCVGIQSNGEIQIGFPMKITLLIGRFPIGTKILIREFPNAKNSHG